MRRRIGLRTKAHRRQGALRQPMGSSDEMEFGRDARTGARAGEWPLSKSSVAVNAAHAPLRARNATPPEVSHNFFQSLRRPRRAPLDQKGAAAARRAPTPTALQPQHLLRARAGAQRPADMKQKV